MFLRRILFLAILWAGSATCRALAGPPAIPSGEFLELTRILEDGGREPAGEALLLDGFPGPVAFLHQVAGARSVRVAAGAGAVEVSTYRAAVPEYDLVVLEAEVTGTPWPAPAQVHVEHDTLWAFREDGEDPIAAYTKGYVEVPERMRLLHLARAPRGPSPLVDCTGRTVGLGAHLATDEGPLGYGVPGGVLLDLLEASRDAAPGPLAELADGEPDWLDPATPPGATLCGGILVLNDRVIEGTAYLERAIDMDPRLAESHYELAVARFQQKLGDEVIREAREAERLRPCYARARLIHGAALFNSRLYDAAESLYVAVLECDSSLAAQVYINLSGVARVQGRRDKVETYLRKALELEPENDLAHFNLAVFWSGIGRRDDALERLEILRSHCSSWAEKLARHLE